MNQHEADRRFREFHRTGDPEAIGRVFDVVAPKLLVVAVHMVKDGAAAEDLVQATFVAAIERAHTFDPNRAVLPWLLGILSNEARMMQRRAARVIDPERRRPSPIPDPAEIAASSELSDRLAAALDAMPNHYQQVLNLRLVHGLAPRQIAHTIGASPATVKSRLRRGLDILRSALPVGFALSTTFVLTATRGLAAVRTHVVDHARAHVPPQAATPQAVGTSKLAGVGLALVCAVASALVFLRPDSTDRDPGALGRTPAETVDRTKENGPRTALAATGQRTKTPAQSTTGAASERDVVIRGRCVDPQGQPIANCLIIMDGLWRSWSRDWFNTPIPWVRPQRLNTDADGRFELAFEPPKPFLLQLHIVPARHAKAVCMWDRLFAGSIEDLGDIVLPPMRSIVGRVIDEAGRPVDGVTVRVASWHSPPTRGGSGTLHLLRPDGTRSRADGSFGPARLVPEGDATLSVSPEVELIGSGKLSGRESRCVLVVRRRVRITGRVLSNAGMPLPGVTVAARGALGFGETKSGMDGSFVIHDAGSATAGKAVSIWTKAGCVPERAKIETTWGSDGVVLRRTALGTTRLTVRDQRTREVIRFYAVLCRPLESKYRDLDLDWIRHACIHEKGITDIDRVFPGRNELMVFPSTDKYLPTRVSFRGGTRAIEVQLERREFMRARVRDARGRPVGQVTVRLLRTAGSTDRSELHHHAFWRMAPEHRFADTEPVRDLIAKGRTNAHGIARIGLPRQGPFRLAVVGSAGIVLAEREVHAARHRELVTIRVPDAATLRGVAKASGRSVPPGCRVRALAMVGDRFLESDPVRLNPDATFEIAGLPRSRCVLVQLEIPVEGGGFERLGSPDHVDLTTGHGDGSFAFAQGRLAVDVRVPGESSLAGRTVRVFAVDERATLSTHTMRHASRLVLTPPPPRRFRIDVRRDGAWVPATPTLGGD